MQTILITLAILTAVILIHVAYVDFRFRYRQGLLWFWLLHPAPPLMWVARGFMGAAVVVALSVPVFGASKTVAYVLAGLMALHLITLVLLEVLEPR